jgi:hypothetical protein
MAKAGADVARRALSSAAGMAIVAVLTALGCVAAPGRLHAQAATANPAACAAKNPMDAETVGKFLFKTYSRDDGVCLRVTSGGKLVYSLILGGAENVTLGQPSDPDNDVPFIKDGTDLTGLGRPDMIVSTFTGGAHCCTTHYVFEMEPQFRLLATLYDAHDDLAHFERAKDGSYDYVTADWTFAYWPDCFACSPSEVVTLRFVNDAKGGAYHLALDKMQKPALTQTEWDKELAAAQKVVIASDVSSIGTTMWQTVLDLIYSGHSDLAWKFVDALGPKAQQKPFPALADFCGLLKQSAYWPDLGPTLKDAPAECAYAGTKPAK